MVIEHYDTKLKIPKLNRKLRYFGIELEVSYNDFLDGKYYSNESIDKRAQEIYPFFKDYGFIFKWDSSVIGGFEIVSLPKLIHDQINDWQNLLSILDNNGLVSYSAPCNGMHIHVSKNQLSNLQIAKVVKFIYNKDNYKFIKKIAQRCQKEQASFKHKRTYKDYRAGMYDRHTAINICSNTLEFRLFRGTLNFEAFCKNLEFCDALIEFCAPSLFSVKESLSWWNFIYFLEKHKNKYNNLWQFCIQRSMTDISEWNKHLEEIKLKKETKDKIIV